MIRKVCRVIWGILVFILLTLLTQVGGLAYVFSLALQRKFNFTKKGARVLVFSLIYIVFTFIITPFLAPFLGREKVLNTPTIRPANFFTILLNRNYVKPELNELLLNVERNLKGTSIQINYLDANFPFINRFPLLPHLSHNDGEKIDLSLVYENEDGSISTDVKSVSGYGVFVDPPRNKGSQIEKCIDEGFIQYDFSKYLTFGSKNSKLKFSSKGTQTLIKAILKEKNLGKIFIEPHLKHRLRLKDTRIRYHGCRSVRHDDHIHIELK